MMRVERRSNFAHPSHVMLSWRERLTQNDVGDTDDNP